MLSAHLNAEARAKLIWGDPPETVLEFLQTQGVNKQQAEGFIASIKRERLATVRSSGIKRIIVGAWLVVPLVVALPLAFWLNYWYEANPDPATAGYTFHYIAGRIAGRICVLAFVAALFGLWKIITGIFLLVDPQSQKGDLSKLPD